MSILQDIYDDAYNPNRVMEDMPAELRKRKAAFDADMEKIGADEVYQRH